MDGSRKSNGDSFALIGEPLIPKQLNTSYFLFIVQWNMTGLHFDDFNSNLALLVGANQLVRPPLVSDLVCRDIGDQINQVVLILFVKVLYEADTFRVRHCICERLSEACVGRELKNARLLELKGREALAEDVARIRAYPLLQKGVSVAGAIYNVSTGQIEPIDC